MIKYFIVIDLDSVLRTLYHIEGVKIFQKGAASRPFEAT